MQTAIVRTAQTFDRTANLSVRIATETVFRHRRLLAGVVSVVVFLTLAASILMTKQYVSEMKFLVQNARGNVVVTPQRTNPVNVVSEVTEGQVNSELEILRSHDVLDPVADPTWGKVPVDERDAAAIREHEALLAAFDKRLETEPVRKTNVIDVRFRASTPEEARTSLQRLADAYLEQHRRMQRPVGASSFFTSEAERYRKEWDEASRRLVDFQQEHQLSSLQQREADIEGKITKGEEDVLTIEAGLKEFDARLAESNHRMRTMSMRHTTQNRLGPNLPSVQQLTTVVTELENKRTALLTNYKPEDRLVRELDRQIAFTRTELSDATSVKSLETTTDIDPVWQQLRTEHAEANIARRAGAARRDAVAAQLTTLKQNLGSLQELDVQFNNLEAQVKERKENYELYVEKRDQSVIADAMDERGLMNVVVAQQPTWPYLPARPKPVLNALLGAVTALFLGLCAIYVAEAGRNTVATPRELDAASRYPVLATISAECGPTIGGVEGTVLGRDALPPVIVHTTRPPEFFPYQRFR
jgi:uncharacterized protein involved in exopolysaccharide biosynthesis